MLLGTVPTQVGLSCGSHVVALAVVHQKKNVVVVVIVMVQIPLLAVRVFVLDDFFLLGNKR